MSKHVPLRHCVACRAERPKHELLRVACSPQGVVALDATGKAAGRGAYICRQATCLQRAQKIRALERHLKAPIDASIYEALTEAVHE